ncbi:MAG: hypothetical protein ACKO3P_24370 [Planctomycetaceae bacterium]
MTRHLLRKPNRREPAAAVCGPACGGPAGISLFEVVLALVILVTSLAAIGQLISSGGRGAVKSRLLTQAVFLAESKMAEIASGAATLASGNNEPLVPDDPTWVANISVSSGPQTDLYIVTVEVVHQANSSLGRVSFDLTRMLRDPGSLIAERIAEEERKAAEEAEALQTSSASTPTSGTGGGTSGGTGTGTGTGAGR